MVGVLGGFLARFLVGVEVEVLVGFLLGFLFGLLLGFLFRVLVGFLVGVLAGFWCVSGRVSPHQLLPLFGGGTSNAGAYLPMVLALYSVWCMLPKVCP